MTLFGVAYADDKPNYDLDINIGNKGTIYIDKKIPINITITNNSSDFYGSLKLMIPLESNSQEKKYYSYDYIMQIPAGESKKIELLETADAKINPGTVLVQLVNRSGRLEYEESYKIRKSYEIKTSIGILSDDYDSLNYLKNTKTYDLINLSDISLDVVDAFSLYDAIFINFSETSI
ncbi:MAG: hypothetical protein WBA54_02195 [Acidaminobacteraceae bacterium]